MSQFNCQCVFLLSGMPNASVLQQKHLRLDSTHFTDGKTKDTEHRASKWWSQDSLWQQTMCSSWYPSLSQQPQPDQARDPNLRALSRTVVYVPNTTPLLIPWSCSKKTGLLPHFTDEETKAQRGCLTLSRSHTSQCQERVWNQGSKSSILTSLSDFLDPEKPGRDGRARLSKWVKRKDTYDKKDFRVLNT